MIEVKDVTKRYGEKTVVRRLSMTVPDGQLTLLIGPSGSGKTTTMKMINRLINPEEGDIILNGQSIFSMNPVDLRRKIGYVIQEVGLFPHFTVFENIAVVPKLLKWDESRIRSRVPEVLELVTLDGTFSGRYPHELSGGERQRVGLARALAADPDILLMDEPFGAIDPINRSRLQDSLLDIQERIRKTVVFVTHDINEAIKLGDRIAIMEKGGLVQYDTAAEILTNPANKFVEKLLGKDRNLKALALTKAKDAASEGSYILGSIKESNQTLRDRLDAAGLTLAFLTDDAGALTGRFFWQGGRATRGTQPFSVDRNANLSEALSTMLMAGEKELPVLDQAGGVVGTITLSAIFDRFGQEPA